MKKAAPIFRIVVEPDGGEWKWRMTWWEPGDGGPFSFPEELTSTGAGYADAESAKTAAETEADATSRRIQASQTYHYQPGARS